MKSAIIYNGQSLLDDKPIVVIATYSNRNTKTGKVVQTYILRSDINPLEASKTGEDYSICGECPMRGEVTTDPERKQAKGRKCYVNLGQGVLIVWKAYKRGVYQTGDAAKWVVVVSFALEPTAILPPFRRTFGITFYPSARRGRRTLTKNHGDQILQCNPRIVTPKQSCIGKQDDEHSE
jgi:hypothetical protein